MKDYSKLLKEQQKEIKQLLKEAEARLKTYTATPEDRISTSKSNGVIQYYIKKKDSNKYVYCKDLELAKSIAQYDYDHVIYEKLSNANLWLTRFLRHYDINALAACYEDKSEGRRRLINPIIESRHSFTERWMAQYENKVSKEFEEGRIYQTDEGGMVRSKSEKIIADLFTKHNVPYVYEPCITLKNGRIFSPNFAVLNVKEQKRYYWEHFGLSDNNEYSDKNLNKLCEYENAGIVVGKNLIISFESAIRPLSTKTIENKIKEYLL